MILWSRIALSLKLGTLWLEMLVFLSKFHIPTQKDYIPILISLVAISCNLGTLNLCFFPLCVEGENLEKVRMLCGQCVIADALF